MRVLIIGLFSVLWLFNVQGQGCCSGGGGSPLSGGASTGVLQKNQMELVSTYQYTRSNRFFSGSQDTTAFFDNLTSNYLFLKVDYGVSEKFTMSVATGYFLNRTITEFADTTAGSTETERETVSSGGIGDLIIFPRYSVYNKTKGVNRTELTLGMGLKIPLGSHRDTTFIGHALTWNPTTLSLDSSEIWRTAPPTVQATTGSHDFMFYGFFYKNFPHRKLRLFASALYVKKGWNSLGLKFGDYGSLGLYAGTTVFDKLSLLGQIKGELVGKMKVNDLIDPLATYSIDTASTGSRKVSFVPQISYTFDNGISIFALADIPLYQYMRGVQISSQHQYTAGISYRFNLKKPSVAPILNPGGLVIGDNSLKLSSFKVWGKCDMCKKTIETTLSAMSGIKHADWNLDELMLEIQYDEKLISVEDVKVELAKIGYDTETHKAKNKAYDKLHACCKYERSK